MSTAASSDLDRVTPAVPWRPARRYRCLDLRFTCRTTSADFDALVAIVFEGCEDEHEAAEHSYALDVGHGGSCTLTYNGETIATSGSLRFALDYLVWHVNQAVVEASRARLLLHAGAAAEGSRAVVVAAPSGGGKSTLVAALVRSGMTYLSDECLALDPTTNTLSGHAKAIGLKPGSSSLFPEVADRPAPTEDYASPTRYATPTMLRSTVAGGATRAALVLVPRFGDGSGPALAEVHRAEVITLLAEQSFNFEEYGTGRLPALHALVAAAECRAIDTTNLATAVAATRSLLHAVDGVAS